MIYIIKIHPRHCPVFGNLTDILDSHWESEYQEYLLSMKVQSGQLTESEKSTFPKENVYYGNIPHGKKFKMWGVSRNNVAEVVAAQSKWFNIRYTIPPISIAIWIQQSINMIKKYLSQIGDLFSEKIPYTSIGVRNFEKNNELHEIIVCLAVNSKIIL